MGVVILGLDAMTWEVVERLMASGDLPVFRDLCNRGASGPLESTVPAVTPSAWPSMLTGKNPGQHGVWGFRHPQPESGPWGFSLVTRFDYESMPLWRILQRFGRRGAFFNVPCAFPLDEQFTAGVLTSGFLTPTIDRTFAHPAAWRERILERHPEFEFKLSWAGSRRSGFIPRGMELARMKFDIIRLLREEEPWDVLFAVVDEPDPIQHGLWASLVGRAPAVVEFYRLLDREVGRLVEDVERRGDTLLIVSDHGFRSVSGLFCVNEALEQTGHLRFVQPRWRAMLRSLAIDAARRMPLGGSAIERYRRRKPGNRIKSVKPLALTSTFRAMRAVGVQSGTCSGVYLADHDPALVDEVYRDLSRLLRSFPEVTVRKGTDLYRGPYADAMPALVVLSHGRTALTTERHGTLTRSLPLLGEHAQDGMVLAAGRGIRPGQGIRMHIYDVLPTVLCLLGLPVPSDVEGTPVAALLSEPAGWRMYDVRSGAVYRPDEAPDPVVQERLRRLGRAASSPPR
jgi:predicted AlkP superfamily phosphohydrolase/phosphomutase